MIPFDKERKQTEDTASRNKHSDTERPALSDNSPLWSHWRFWSFSPCTPWLYHSALKATETAQRCTDSLATHSYGPLSPLHPALEWVLCLEKKIFTEVHLTREFGSAIHKNAALPGCDFFFSAYTRAIIVHRDISRLSLMASSSTEASSIWSAGDNNSSQKKISTLYF